jgi:hypothetical protein
MTLFLLLLIATLLLIADTTLGRPDRVDQHATPGERLVARVTPGRVALTVAVAAALPLFGLIQILKVTATLAAPHLAAALAA